MTKNLSHIAFHVYGLHGGGAERVIVNLANEFAKQGIKVDIVLNYLAGSYLSEVSSKVRVVNLNSARGRDGFGILQLTNYLRKEKPDALLATTHFSNERAILAKLLSGSSTKIFVREANHLLTRAKNEPQKTMRLVPLATRLSYPLADGIIAVCNGVADNLVEITNLPSERIKVIYNPTVTPNLLLKGKEKIEHPWFEEGEPPVILGVGRLTKQKDFPTLIRAFAKVKEVKPARLMILGQAWNNPDSQVMSLIKKLNLEKEVALPGFQKNPYPYMAQADVFVLSSRWEGLSNALIEAMALGTPVVATDCPGGSAEILGSGKYGELVPVGDSDVMAQAILKILSGDIKPVNADWLEQFTLETATKQYIKAVSITNN